MQEKYLIHFLKDISNEENLNSIVSWIKGPCDIFLKKQDLLLPQIRNNLRTFNIQNYQDQFLGDFQNFAEEKTKFFHCVLKTHIEKRMNCLTDQNWQAAKIMIESKYVERILGIKPFQGSAVFAASVLNKTQKTPTKM